MAHRIEFRWLVLAEVDRPEFGYPHRVVIKEGTRLAAHIQPYVTESPGPRGSSRFAARRWQRRPSRALCRFSFFGRKTLTRTVSEDIERRTLCQFIKPK